MNSTLSGDEKERLAAVAKYRQLKSLPYAALDAITQAAANFCGTSTASISLVGSNHVHFLSLYGASLKTMDRDYTFCDQVVIKSQTYLEVKDALLDKRFERNSLVIGAPYIRYYLGIPLVTSDGYAIGGLAVMDSKPQSVSGLQRDGLQKLADAVMSLLSESLVQHNLGSPSPLQTESSSLLPKLQHLSVLDAIRSQAAVLDQKGTILHVNKAWKDFVVAQGYDGRDANIIGKQYLGVCHYINSKTDEEDNHSSLAFEGVLAVLRGEIKHFELEYPCHSEYGKHWFLMSAVPFNDFGGSALVMHLDVSKRKIAELRETNFQHIIEASLNEIYIFDALTFKFILVNDRAKENLGYNTGELVKMTPFNINNEYTKVSFLQATRSLVNNPDAKLKLSGSHIRKDGSRYPIEAFVQWSLFDDRPVFTGIVVDISEREKKRHEMQSRAKVLEKIASGAPLREMLMSMVLACEHIDPTINASISLFDPNNNELRDTVSHSLPSYYIDAINGLHVADNVGTCGSAAFRGERVISEDIRNDPNWDVVRDLVERANLRACWSEPILSSDKKVLGTLAFYYKTPGKPGPETLALTQNMTYLAGIAIERSRAEHALKELNVDLEQRIENRTIELSRALTKLEEANRAIEHTMSLKSRFLAAAGHDLRQPLQALGLFLAALSRRLQEPKNLHIADKMRSSLDSMREILDALLDISRLDSGLTSPNKSDFNIQNILRRIVNDNMQQALSKGLLFECFDEDYFVYSDEGLLERIIENFVTNAIRYTQQGHVFIKGEIVDSVLRISVEDSGIGVPDTDLDSIFEEYYQLNNPARNQHKGLGLGLSIVKHISVLLEHKVEVSSRVDTGSVFSVNVPLGKIQDSHDINKSVSDATGKKQVVVLFVDDDEGIVESLSLFLEAESITVYSAVNGDDALKHIANGVQPDILISDFRLPGYNGTEVVKRIREKTKPDLPAILMTGDTSAKHLESVTDANYTVMRKPIDTNILLGMIRQWA